MSDLSLAQRINKNLSHLSRRDFLRLSTVAAGTGLVAACSRSRTQSGFPEAESGENPYTAEIAQLNATLVSLQAKVEQQDAEIASYAAAPTPTVSLNTPTLIPSPEPTFTSTGTATLTFAEATAVVLSTQGPEIIRNTELSGRSVNGWDAGRSLPEITPANPL